MPPTAIVIDALDPAVTADVDLPAGGFGGVVTGPSGPLWQASLSFRNVDTGFTQTAQVDPNGNFGIGYIPTGSYEITVAYDWGRTYSFGVFETGDTGLSVSLAVPAQLSGTVTTSAGDPIEGATVSLVTVFGLWSFSTVAVDADGRYQFPFETSGNFYLSVQTPGNDAKYWYGSGYDDPITTPGSILTLTFGEQDVVPFVIPTGGFSGSIIGDAPTSNATATFELVDGSFSRTVAIAGNGSVSIGSIPEGAYTITVSYDVGSGFIRTYSFPGTYTTGPNGLAISLQYPVPPVAAATMRGVVRNPDLSPADGARVRVLAAGDIEVAETLSEPDGTYVVTVAPGTYRVLATKGTSAVDEPSVFLDEGATLVKDFTMASAFGLGVVQGTVVDADGVAFESGSVFVQCADGTSRSVTLTNGELNTEIPTATTCVARFTNFSTLDHFGTSYSASIAHPIIPLTAGTNQTWQIPTATITLNVVDGDGTDIEVQQVTNNTYTFIPPPPGTPPGFINDASANTSIGQPMGMPGGPTITGAPYTLPTLRATNNNLTVRLPDGRTYQRTIDTTTDNTVIELVVAGQTPIWIVSAAGEERRSPADRASPATATATASRTTVRRTSHRCPARPATTSRSASPPWTARRPPTRPSSRTSPPSTARPDHRPFRPEPPTPLRRPSSPSPRASRRSRSPTSHSARPR